MAQHAQLRTEANLDIYFCDPQSPWQRGTNENTNGLLRQYFPNRTDLHRHSRNDLDAVAAALNSRPRKTLSYKTPLRPSTNIYTPSNKAVLQRPLEPGKFAAVEVEHLVFDLRLRFDRWFESIELLGDQVLPRLRELGLPRLRELGLAD